MKVQLQGRIVFIPNTVVIK